MGKILNPMCGEAVMGIVAGYLGYTYTGIDIREEQITSNKEQTDKILKGRDGTCTWLLGNGLDVDTIYKGDKVDFIFSCPPYYDLEVYSEDKNDISALQTYEEFIAQYQEIITKSIALLNDNRFACFVVSDIRDKEGFYRNFVSDTINCFINAGMLLYNEMVLIHVAGSLPIRVAKAFGNRKVGKMHENVLVFYKGDPKTIKDNYKEIQVEWDDTCQ
jgi:DNA modification methylase